MLVERRHVLLLFFFDLVVGLLRLFVRIVVGLVGIVGKHEQLGLHGDHRWLQGQR